MNIKETIENALICLQKKMPDYNWDWPTVFDAQPNIIKPSDISGFIDHTILKADTTGKQIKLLCKEALDYKFKAVCIPSRFIADAVEFLHTNNSNSRTIICTVVGFPLGNSASAIKAYETAWAVKSGALEIDMVIPVGSLKSGAYIDVYADISEVVRAAGAAKVKAILETAYLSPKEIVVACMLAEKAGVSFVKTSTGFASCGAQIKDVILMRNSISSSVGVKASGGIRDFNEAKAFIEAGATRLGTSKSVEIVTNKG